ncbi:MAG: hypothetical protein J5886_04190 [Bacteroidales bacterium]|nr:hypothetical protein [Bacteroidales bacterium]
MKTKLLANIPVPEWSAVLSLSKDRRAMSVKSQTGRRTADGTPLARRRPNYSHRPFS